MTYSASSPILGTGIATAADIQAWFKSHNADVMTGLGRAIVAECELTGVNADVMAAQVAHETGYWTSYAANQLNNPAGLGITNGLPQDQWPGFVTPRAGLHAQAAHLLTYVMGRDNPWWNDDPRAKYVPASNLGTVRTIGALGGTWAVPGLTYGEAIARLASDLAAFAQQRQEAATMTAIPTQQDIGYPVRVHWAADQGPLRDIKDIQWFVVHDTEGWEDGSETTLTRADDNIASATCQINRDGTLIFMVPLERTPWTAGNDAVSIAGIHVELVGFVTMPFTEEQYRSCANFFRWCVKQGMNVPPEYAGKQERRGIIGHADIAHPSIPGRWGGSSGHTDPGPLFDWGKLVNYIKGGQPAQPAQPDVFLAPTGKTISGGFLAFWRSLDINQVNLRLLGWPLSGEFLCRTADWPQEFTVQVFERGTLIWRGGEQPPWDVAAVNAEEDAAVRAYAREHGLLA